jgi:hypothetical protein
MPGTGGTFAASTNMVPVLSVGTAQEVGPLTSSPSSQGQITTTGLNLMTSAGQRRSICCLFQCFKSMIIKIKLCEISCFLNFHFYLAKFHERRSRNVVLF